MTGPRNQERGESPQPWPGHPTALAPLSKLRRGGLFVDDRGIPGRLGTLAWLFQLARHAAFAVLDGGACTLLFLLGRGAKAPTPRLDPHSQGPLVVVLPILPDLSHTFVYREVAALRALDKSLVLVVLERGSTRVVHPEAAQLMPGARSLPLRGVCGRTLLFLRTLLRHPLRLRRLAGLYLCEPGGAGAALLGKLPLREPRHPGRALELAAELARLRPSQLHVYGSTSAANVALGAAILLDLPLSISSYVDFEFDYAHKLLATKFAQARFFRVCTLDCRRRLSTLLGLGAEATDARVPVLHWGIDARSMRARPAGEAPRLQRERLQLFTACRVVPKKGTHLVPAVMASLRRRGVQAHWTLCGEGPDLDRVKAAAELEGVAADCTFAGPLPNDVVLDRLAATDIAILPCLETVDGERDGIPVFLIEAMALGRVILTTPVSGIPELVVDADTGFLAPADPDALARCILRILADRAGSLAVAARGREIALNGEDSARSAELLLARLSDRGDRGSEGADRREPQTPN